MTFSWRALSWRATRLICRLSVPFINKEAYGQTSTYKGCQTDSGSGIRFRPCVKPSGMSPDSWTQSSGTREGGLGFGMVGGIIIIVFCPWHAWFPLITRTESTLHLSVLYLLFASLFSPPPFIHPTALQSLKPPVEGVKLGVISHVQLLALGGKLFIWARRQPMHSKLDSENDMKKKI